MQAISGCDPLDPTTADAPVPDMLEDIERGREGPAHRRAEAVLLGQRRCRRSSRSCARRSSDLEAAGASVREVEWPRGARLHAPLITIMFADAVAYHAPNFPSRRADYSAQVAALLDARLDMPAAQYVAAMRLCTRCAPAAPTRCSPASMCSPCRRCPSPPRPSPRRAERSRRPHGAFTGPIDLTGQPAISVPCGLTSRGPAREHHVRRAAAGTSRPRSGPAAPTSRSAARGAAPAPALRLRLRSAKRYPSYAPEGSPDCWRLAGITSCPCNIRPAPSFRCCPWAGDRDGALHSIPMESTGVRMRRFRRWRSAVRRATGRRPRAPHHRDRNRRLRRLGHEGRVLRRRRGSQDRRRRHDQRRAHHRHAVLRPRTLVTPATRCCSSAPAAAHSTHPVPSRCTRG